MTTWPAREEAFNPFIMGCSYKFFVLGGQARHSMAFLGPRPIETWPQPHEGLGHTPSCDAGSKALNLHLEGGGGLLQWCQAWPGWAWKPLGEADIILLHREKGDRASSLEVIPHLNTHPTTVFPTVKVVAGATKIAEVLSVVF